MLPEAEGQRIGMAVPELRHVIHAYEAVRRLRRGPRPHHHGPVPRRALSRTCPVATTIHGPFNDGAHRPLPGHVGPGAPHRHLPRPAPGRARRSRWPGSSTTASRPRSSRSATAAGDADGPYVLFLGRMADDKGCHRAIEVARRAGIRILMAAKMREPWEMQYFAEKVEPLLGPDAVYLGEVSHERKLELLAGASALLFPIRWNEPFGMVMIEAMACGTPVLAFPEGAAPEVVTDGTTGFLCDDEDAMVEALGRLDELKREDCRLAVEGYFSTRPDGGRAHRAVRVDARPDHPSRSPGRRPVPSVVLLEEQPPDEQDQGDQAGHLDARPTPGWR